MSASLPIYPPTPTPFRIFSIIFVKNLGKLIALAALQTSHGFDEQLLNLPAFFFSWIVFVRISTHGGWPNLDFSRAMVCPLTKGFVCRCGCRWKSCLLLDDLSINICGKSNLKTRDWRVKLCPLHPLRVKPLPACHHSHLRSWFFREWRKLPPDGALLAMHGRMPSDISETLFLTELSCIGCHGRWIPYTELDGQVLGDSHDRQIFKRHGHVHDSRGQSYVDQFPHKRLVIVLLDWLA